MKRSKTDILLGRRLKMSHAVLGLGVLYLILISLKFPLFLEMVSMLSGEDSFVGLDGSSRDLDRDKQFFNSVYQDVFHRNLEDTQTKNVPEMPRKQSLREFPVVSQTIRPISNLYGRLIGDVTWRKNVTTELSELEKMAIEAWALGLKAWEELGNDDFPGTDESDVIERKPESCPSSVSLTGEEMAQLGHIMFLPCGLAAGSSITVVGTPEKAHEEYVPELTKFKDGNPIVFVSQFMIELQGLKVVDGEDPPKILHLNPRLQGDWSQVPVIEHNTCYRMQWGTAQRCDGLPSRNEDDTVDGFGKCEKWIRSGIVDSKESKTSSWLKRFIGRAKKPEMTWPFPFMEERLFVLTIRAGMEGYHIIVGGRHISSFPYRTGFSLEEATGLSINGNVRVQSIYGTGLPISHPSFSLQQVLEMSETWKTPPLPTSPIDLFIGILSAANHFAERMAIRKTWMQFPAIRSSNIVARFFVALNPRNKVNALLKKEADYFGDIVILPFMDHYELVVLKTLAICEYGVQNVTAAYIMKCDDDTFVRVETVLKEIKSVSGKKPLYMGNLNFLHRPLRSGKWAVTYEEWPEAIYPPYANGPGYIISVDIARFIISQRDNQSLRLFKMEDVSMGLWVEQFNISTSVQYSHNWKFCQYGCMEDYYTAHYQSPRQMICLWDKLARGHAHCCNLR